MFRLGHGAHIGPELGTHELFFSIDGVWSWSMARPWRSEVVVNSISWITSGSVAASLLHRARRSTKPQGAEADRGHHRLLARTQRERVVSTVRRSSVADHGESAWRRSTAAPIGMLLRWMYCQMSSSVQLEMGKTRTLSPLALRAL